MLVKKLKSRLSSKFVQNAGWLGLAELLNRIFRLATTVVLARMFSPYDYGLVAILYTVHSFAEVFTSKVGIGAKIVQTEKQHLNAICNTAYWFSWMLCSGIFLLQCLAAIPIAWIYEDNQLILPICIVSLKYLMLPIFKVPSALLKRENRLKVHAISNAASSLASNAITVLLALLGFGIWAIVWAMLLSTVVRAIIYNTQYTWQPPQKFHLERWQDVAGFGSSMLGVGLLDRLRSNLDYLIVGHFLGIEALGLYFFAFNAGIGISQNVISAFISSLFPYLCEVRNNVQKFKSRYLGSLKTIALVVIPLVILQASLTPFYVPIVFGEKWLAAIPVVSIICLSAIPMAFALAAYQLLNAADKIRITLIWNGIYTVLFATAILIAVQWGILWVAVAVLLCQGLTLIFSVWSTQYVFHKVCVR